MQLLKIWNTISWCITIGLELFFVWSGVFSFWDINYDHYFEWRLLALLFLLHAVSLSLVCRVLKTVVPEPPCLKKPASRREHRAPIDPIDDLNEF